MNFSRYGRGPHIGQPWSACILSLHPHISKLTNMKWISEIDLFIIHTCRCFIFTFCVTLHALLKRFLKLKLSTFFFHIFRKLIFNYLSHLLVNNSYVELRIFEDFCMLAFYFMVFCFIGQKGQDVWMPNEDIDDIENFHKFQRNQYVCTHSEIGFWFWYLSLKQLIRFPRRSFKKLAFFVSKMTCRNCCWINDDCLFVTRQEHQCWPLLLFKDRVRVFVFLPWISTVHSKWRNLYLSFISSP